jgi:sulfide dehydrogenase cytochrome subunit
MILKKYALLLASGLILSTSTWATDWDLSILVGNCIGCHGPEGSSLGPATPTIAGLEEETFVEAMEEFKQGERPSTIMERIAKGYTQKELVQMADYFAKQPFVRHTQEIDAQKAKMGQKLHRQYCEKCHEDNGYTDHDGSGILAGQWMPNLQFNLADFHTGVRDMPKKMKKRLQKMVNRYGEESLENIVHFYGSQTRSDVKSHEDHDEDDHDSDDDSDDD